jgi:predicted nuclease of predicted toxin-antitoxin system
LRFLIDGNLPRSLVGMLTEAGHEALHVRDGGLGDAEDSKIADYARRRGYALMTRDFDFADIRTYPPRDYHGLVIIDLPETAVASAIQHLVQSLLLNKEVLDLLPGRLAIVEFGRIRLREA